MANIITDAKEFAGGGWDTETALDKVAPQDFVGGLNIRTTGSDQHERGNVTDIESTELIISPRGEGVYKTVCSRFFKKVDRSYALVHHDGGKHLIVEFNRLTQEEIVLYEDKTDSGGAQLIPLSLEKRVSDIKLVHDKFLVFTDGLSSIKCVNIDKLRNKTGVLTEESFSLIKAPPLSGPFVFYNDDSSRGSNLLQKKLFQFISQYEYNDYMPSVWSTTSNRPVPDSELAPGSSTDVTKNNNLVVYVDAGSADVQKVNVAARDGIYDWYLVRSVDRSYITSLPNYGIDVSNGVMEAYDPETNKYSFAFYNDGEYQSLDQVEVDSYYDRVPETAETLEIVNGNILALGGLREGKVRPDTKVKFEVTYYKPNVNTVPVDQSNALKVADSRINEYVNGIRVKQEITLTGQPKIGDVITVMTYNNKNPQERSEYTYTAVLADQNNLYGFIDNLVSKLGLQGERVGNKLFIILREYHAMQSFIITLANTVSGPSKSIRSMKTNSSYQFALRYRDKYGRFFPLITGRDFVINTRSLAQSNGLLPEVTWTLQSETAPEGAADYQIMISENSTHQEIIYANGKLSQTAADYYELDITPLYDFNRRNPSSVLTYEYVEGDRVTFVQYSMNVLPNQYLFFNDELVDLQVLGFEIKVTEVEGQPKKTQYILRVSKTSRLDSKLFDLSNILVEIYRPKKRADKTSPTDNLWFEFGERYTIADGKHETMTGLVREADTFYKTRSYALATDLNVLQQYLVEDFNFSDHYPSRFTSYGRGGYYDDEPGLVDRGAYFRYSDPSIPGAKYMGLNRFYAERLYGEGPGETSSSYGTIMKMRMRDSFLVVVQQTRVCHVPVNLSILSDQAGNQNVSVSDRLFNKAVYIASGNRGIGSLKESYAESENGTIYFVDASTYLPVRDGYDGVKVLSVKMERALQDFVKNVVLSGGKIIGAFDDTHHEFLLTALFPDGVADVTWVWGEDDNRWGAPRSITPESGFSAGDNFYSYKGGKLWKHDLDIVPRNNFYGSQYVSEIEFVANGSRGVLKTFRSLSYEASDLMVTPVDGIQTSTGQLSELSGSEFLTDTLDDGTNQVYIYQQEGVYSAGFLFDKAFGLLGGVPLKGSYIKIRLRSVNAGKLVLRNVVVKSIPSFIGTR